MFILITRLQDIRKYSSKNRLYLSNIGHDVTASKIPFLSLLPRECIICLDIFIKKNSCMQGHYQYRQKCILKICNFLLWRMIWVFELFFRCV